jgi:plastocyanin
MNKKYLMLLALIPAVALMAGCNGSSDGGNGSTDGGTGGATKAAFPEDKATVSVSGSVKFEGQAQKRKKLDVNKDTATCLAKHGGTPPLAESLIVNGNGTLKNVVVYVSKGLAKYSFPKNTTPAKFGQVGCVYVPHVQPVQAGQPLHVSTSDDLSHNVHWMSKKNGDKNISQNTAGMIDTTSFKTKRQEIGTARFQCDVHGWMKSYVPIFMHPLFVVTGDDGSFSLPKKLPAGKYSLTAWHEKLGTQTQVIEVKDGESKTVDFNYSGKPGN